MHPGRTSAFVVVSALATTLASCASRYEREHVVIVPEKTEVTKDVDYDGEAVASQSIATLADLAAVMGEEPQLRVVISVCGEDGGGKGDELRLSRRRGMAVRQVLIDQGVAPLRLELLPRGKEGCVRAPGKPYGTEFLIANPSVLERAAKPQEPASTEWNHEELEVAGRRWHFPLHPGNDCGSLTVRGPKLEATTEVIEQVGRPAWTLTRSSDQEARLEACAANCFFHCDRIKLRLLYRFGDAR